MIKVNFPANISIVEESETVEVCARLCTPVDTEGDVTITFTTDDVTAEGIIIHVSSYIGMDGSLVAIILL